MEVGPGKEFEFGKRGEADRAADKQSAQMKNERLEAIREQRETTGKTGARPEDVTGRGGEKTEEGGREAAPEAGEEIPPPELTKKEKARRAFLERQKRRQAGVEKSEAQAKESLDRAADALRRLGESFEKRDPNKLYSFGTEQADLAFEAVSALVEAGYNESKALFLKVSELVDKKYMAIKGFRDALEDAYDAYADADEELPKREKGIDDTLKEGGYEFQKPDTGEPEGEPPEVVPPDEEGGRVGPVRDVEGGAGKRGVRATRGGRSTSTGGHGAGTGGVSEPAAGRRGQPGRGEQVTLSNYRMADLASKRQNGASTLFSHASQREHCLFSHHRGSLTAFLCLSDNMVREGKYAICR